MEEQDWVAQTRSYLASTLPLDTGRAIMFLPEQGSSKRITTQDSTDNSPSQQQSTLSGKEAKEFYEEILSMPQERKVKLKKKLKPSRIRRTSARRKCKVIETVPTVGEVFRFAQDGELESLKSAISKGHYNVNMTDTFGWTLLMSAAYAGHTDTVEYLMSVGAEWTEKINSSGQNAVDLALTAGHIHIAELIKHCSSENNISSSNLLTEGKDGILCVDASDFQNDDDLQVSSEKIGPSFCDICKLNVSHEAPHKHSTSTLHQFNCQHHPSPHVAYGIPQSNRGYQMLLRKGWDPESGLGSDQQGQQFPVKTVLKRDRLGFGIKSKDKARVTHFEAGDTAAVRRPSDSIETKQLKKKEIMREAKKDKQWELSMRQYLSTDNDY